MTTRTHRRWLSPLLGSLQTFIGLGGAPSGPILILDPSGTGMGFSLDLLEGTFLPSCLIPGLFLLGINRVTSLMGGILSFPRHWYTGEIWVVLGFLLIAWIVSRWR